MVRADPKSSSGSHNSPDSAQDRELEWDTHVFVDSNPDDDDHMGRDTAFLGNPLPGAANLSHAADAKTKSTQPLPVAHFYLGSSSLGYFSTRTF